MLKKIISRIVDRIFFDIGFKKEQDDDYAVVYSRYNYQFEFNQKLCIAHKRNGMHICQSYDESSMDENKIGNICVGLTSYEMKLCVLKMWAKGWNTKKRVQYAKHKQ